jgi:hypothetical protein
MNLYKSIRQALKSVFPEYEWDDTKFRTFSVEKGYWSKPEHQRTFFDQAARTLGTISMHL